MTDRKRQKLLSGGENGNGDRLGMLAELNYTFDTRSYFGKDTDFVKRSQLYDVWLWKKFVSQFRIYGVDDKKGFRYHNGWRSEFWGKMMRGATLVCAYAKDDALHEILTDSVRDLLTAQDELGRITTYSKEYEFNGWDLWGRKYVLLGLQYYLEICRDDTLAEQILGAMKAHADYIMKFIGPEEEGKTPAIKATAHWGGLNSASILEPYVRLYNLTGEEKYLEFAEHIVESGACSSENVFEAAYADEKAPFEYAQVKAYEMMSCFEGLIEYYRVTGIEKYREAAIRFGYKVLKTDVTVIGCCGCTHELFDNSAKMQTQPAGAVIMQETCVTVTWMKICHQLLRLTGDRAFADAIEQSFVNAYLGAFNTHHVVPPEYNGERIREEDKNPTPSYCFMPFDSYSPLTADIRGRKIGGLKFFTDHTYYGCCACIGAAGMGIMGRISVMENEKGLCFQYYIGGRVELTTKAGAKAVLRVDTDYPYSTSVKITVESWDPAIGAISFRIPEWSERTVATICGEELAVHGHYMTVKRAFAEGDEIGLSFDDRVRMILPPYADGPDADRYAAYAIGPVLLAKDARLGDYLHDGVFPAVDEDGYVPYEKNEGVFAEIPDARMFINLKRTDGQTVRLIDYSSAGKTYTKESECAAWLERKANKSYKLAINAEAKKGVEMSEALRAIKAAGFDGVFTGWKQGAPVDAWAEEIRRLGLVYQSIHAPFGRVQTLWEEGDEGDAFTDEMIDCIHDAKRIGVPLVVIHPIAGMDRHTPNELGLVRFEKLIREAERTGMKLAFENVEGIEYLEAIMKCFSESPAVCFCWDTGHEMCYNFSEDVMARYGKKLIATHFNDNLGITDPQNVTWHDDLHLLPFDGVADWQGIMDRIRRDGYEGMLTFELKDQNKPGKHTHDRYASWSVEEFYKQAYERAVKVAAL